MLSPGTCGMRITQRSLETDPFALQWCHLVDKNDTRPASQAFSEVAGLGEPQMGINNHAIYFYLSIDVGNAKNSNSGVLRAFYVYDRYYSKLVEFINSLNPHIKWR